MYVKYTPYITKVLNISSAIRNKACDRTANHLRILVVASYFLLIFADWILAIMTKWESSLVTPEKNIPQWMCQPHREAESIMHLVVELSLLSLTFLFSLCQKHYVCVLFLRNAKFSVSWIWWILWLLKVPFKLLLRCVITVSRCLP